MKVSLLVSVISGLVILAGCSKQNDGAHPDPYDAYNTLQNASIEQSVAIVNGRALSIAEFEVFWSEHSELERAQAIDKFIERELLAQKGEHSKLVDRAEFGFVRKQGMVAALLRDTVENEINAESISQSELDTTVRNIREQLLLPEGLQASHLVVLVPGHQSDSAWKAQGHDAAARIPLYEQALVLAKHLRQELGERSSVDDLSRIASSDLELLSNSALEVVVNAHLKFPLAQSPRMAAGWMNVVPEFRRAAKLLYETHGTGVLSEPVQSDFGWHLIVVEEHFPASEPEPDALRKAALENLLKKHRAARVDELLSQWRERAVIHLMPQAISEQGTLVRE